MYRHPEHGLTNLADVIENRLHTVLKKTSKFMTYGMLFDELEAARSWGVHPISRWSNYARDDRIWMVALDQADRVKEAIEYEDARLERERKKKT